LLQAVNPTPRAMTAANNNLLNFLMFENKI